MQYLDSIVDQLREQGYRLTVQRMAVLRALAGSDSHPTAEEIHQQITGDFPMLSLATVYKVLNVLRELGAVTELKVEGASRYDLNADAHPHLVCVRCRTVIDLSSDLMPPLPEKAVSEHGFHPLWQEMVIYGLCPRCQAGDGQA